MLAEKLEQAVSEHSLMAGFLPAVSPEFNACALDEERCAARRIFKDSFFSNKGPRLKISKRVRLERSVFRAFRNDK